MILHKINAIISTATMVTPTGVEPKIEIIIPIKVQRTDKIAEQMITPLKLKIILIEDKAGKITSADIKREPTKFIANTIIIAVITAINKWYRSDFVPVAFAKFSSKVTAKIRL